MFKNLKNPVSRLRLIGIIEGTSFLILLGIAMPLKYMAGIPEVVKVVGWLHGIFFMLFIAAVLQVHFLLKWKFIKLLGALAASVIPFGTFILDRNLRKDEELLKERASVRINS